MLKLIPFYGTLLKRELVPGFLATRSYVLIYGAIEAHSFNGDGCFASNATLAKETGLNSTTIPAIISRLAKAGWIKVELDSNNHRKVMIPLLDIKGGFVAQQGGYYSTTKENDKLTQKKDSLSNSININTQNNIKKEVDATSHLFLDGQDLAKQGPPLLKNGAPRLLDDMGVHALYYRIIKKYGLPVSNHHEVRTKSRAMEQEIGIEEAKKYLQVLLDVDYRTVPGEFKPGLFHARDIYNNRLKIMRFLSTHTAPRTADQELVEQAQAHAEAEADRLRYQRRLNGEDV